MGDASSVDQNMGAGPMMGGGEGPSMGMNQNAENEAPMPDDMGGMPENGEGSGDDTMSMFNELSTEDKEAARKYIESMLNKDESQENNDEVDGPSNEIEQMPMEAVIFTKGQLKKINENIGINIDDEKTEKILSKRTDKTKNKVKNSPFNSPKFN